MVKPSFSSLSLRCRNICGKPRVQNFLIRVNCTIRLSVSHSLLTFRDIRFHKQILLGSNKLGFSV
jgi:hypothetical protein